MKRCTKCEEWHVIDSTCKDCKEIQGTKLNVVEGMTLTVESDGLASINGVKLKSGAQYHPQVGDVIMSHQDIHASEKIDISHGEYHVINRGHSEFEALMGGNLAEMKPIRNYTDNPGMFTTIIKTNVDLI